MRKSISTSYNLPLGAHLTTPRLGYVHHGVYAGEGRVIHYAGFKRLFRRGPVEEISLEDFAGGRGFSLRPWVAPMFSGSETVSRARSRLGENGSRFWTNNCEHLAEWCISGTGRSTQVEAWRGLVPRLTRIVSSEIRRAGSEMPG